MNTEKAIYKSKTIIGAVLTFLVVLLPQLGISFTADDSAMFSQLVDQICIVITSAFTIYGRFTADSKVVVK